MTTRPLRLFNTLTRSVGDFRPATDNVVGMYSCGPTVYAHQHIGNMRAYVFADTLKRVLLRCGYVVRHVINITDVGHLTSDADEGEDKLEVAARRQGVNARQVADHYTSLFKRDLVQLRIVEPDVWCKATDHIEQMIDFARELDAGGWCYALPTGLYMDTSKVHDYGKLAHLNLEGQREGARVDVVQGKRNPSDFAIWRNSIPSEMRQMEWDSPWGRGYPGWHLECSVMSIRYLGAHFDIHTGGVDHIPIHHTNEIAQSEAYLSDRKPWVQWWLHGEFVNLQGAKLSKSTGGGVVVSDLVESGFHPLVYRYLLLQAHYRSQMEFSWSAMDAARVGLRRLLDRFHDALSHPAELGLLSHEYVDAFDDVITDDLNTSAALAVVASAARDDRLSPAELSALASHFDEVLAIGLSDLSPTALDLPRDQHSISADDIEMLFAKRAAARAARDFATSDAVRDELRRLNVAVEDLPDGTSSWRWI
jgi:cysteinyl-tRNA synthetase